MRCGVKQHDSIVITTRYYMLLIKDVQAPRLTLEVTLHDDPSLLTVLCFDDRPVSQTD